MGSLEKTGKFDLHLHSKYSADALPGPESIVKEALCKRLKGFAMTDHNSVAGFAELKKLQKQEKGLLIVRGEEVKICENGKCTGELLCYFLQEKIKPAGFGEVLDAAREQDALISIAHPFDFGRKPFCGGLEKAAQKVDAVEVFNARSYSARANELAKEFAEKQKLAFTAGSDAHSLAEIGNAGIECDARNEEELRKAILKRKCKVFGKERASRLGQSACSLKARIGFKES